jgi:glycosyltransferase involved in cell wall biosynthesis
MKVSIIMSCCDRSNALRNTLESWTDLTYPNYEFFLYDNASDNEAAIQKVVEEFSPRFPDFHFIRNHTHANFNMIWNKVAKLFSTGEYVIFAMADEIISTKDIIQRMAEMPIDARCSVNTTYLDPVMTKELDTLKWKKDPRIIESIPGFWNYKIADLDNRDRVNPLGAGLLSHITGWTREKWEWFGWFRDEPTGFLWIDQDVVMRSRCLKIGTHTVPDVLCYHQHHAPGVFDIQPGYRYRNERQARLLEPAERDRE